jgi:hypothetical protein
MTVVRYMKITNIDLSASATCLVLLLRHHIMASQILPLGEYNDNKELFPDSHRRAD